MIVTLTLNPALDKTVVLNELCLGELNRLGEVITDAGGKGLNVSKVIAALGGQSIATGFLGAGVGAQILEQLTDIPGISVDFVPVATPARTNLKIMDSDSRLTELNEPGVEATAAEAAQLRARIMQFAAPETIFVLSGSLCRGIAADFYAQLIVDIHAAGARAYLDADGAAFAAAMPAHPDFVKPNWAELAEYLHIATSEAMPSDIAMWARDLGVAQVAVSLGSNGAVFVSGDQAWHARALDVPVHSTVGAGDAMMAAFAYAKEMGLPFPQAAKLAIAVSAGAVTTTGTKPASAELTNTLLAKVELHPIK